MVTAHSRVRSRARGTGNPNGQGLPNWPAFRDMPSGRVIVLGDTVQVEPSPFTQQLGFDRASAADAAADYHGRIWNHAEPARSLGVSEPTIRRYLDALTGVFMIRQLPPWHENLAKHQIKSPKVYLRDSGLLHASWGSARTRTCCAIRRSAPRGTMGRSPPTPPEPSSAGRRARRRLRRSGGSRLRRPATIQHLTAPVRTHTRAAS
jgi:hypothetical protein